MRPGEKLKDDSKVIDKYYDNVLFYFCEYPIKIKFLKNFKKVILVFHIIL